MTCTWWTRHLQPGSLAGVQQTGAIVHYAVTQTADCLQHRLRAVPCTLAASSRAQACSLVVQGERAKRRFEFLLKQVDVLQHFAPDKAEKGKKCAPLCGSKHRPSLWLQTQTESAQCLRLFLQRLGP